MASFKEKYLSIVEREGRMFSARLDDVAYYDKNVKRWRAGELAPNDVQGRFISETRANRIRGANRRNVNAVNKGVTIYRDNLDITRKQAVNEGYEWIKEYFSLKRTGLLPHMDIIATLDEQYNIRQS